MVLGYVSCLSTAALARVTLLQDYLPQDRLKCRTSLVQCVQVNIFLVWMIAVRMGVVAEN